MKEKPVTVALGTAAYPTGEAVGTTMLEVGPPIRTFPIAASLVVSTAKTVLLLESKAATMFRVGDSAIRPGELPAPRGETRGRVSFEPSIMTKLPKAEVELTPCEARTRFLRPLGGFFLALLPQAVKVRVAHNATTRTRMRLFKRRAPNDMKKGDLIAKWWIITDPKPGPHVGLRA
jgi:hypothetical protein